ncbi:MAG: 4,5-DOPA dioxygenase extradiol [Acidobacteria bacterium]|nr:4,5-DOPA dioxygenase extradiol [Acidobacteriota bacterium]MCA1638867.1 4,5-DOPA dioxygenase extradiol [Acidobacteriota bacterium]
MNTLKELQNLGQTEKRMPVLFIGHGSPMNGIEHNEFTENWKQAVEYIPKPKAIVVVSAHWETRGTFVTVMPQPPTIYDFGGFPRELFEAKYPAKGSPETAREISANIKQTAIGLDDKGWGLDHGTWTILRHMYPNADVPAVQLSLHYDQPAQWHFELAKELTFLRKRGVLIIGSGNIVHNLRKIDFHGEREFEWAKIADETLRKHIFSGDFQKLIRFESLGREVLTGIPTPEHFLPLLYTLGLRADDEEISLFNDKLVYGSLSMTSIKIGN